ncbi:MAG TPA: DNA-formamidopyrimidine glycosylase family protein [Acetobacteraceae bacterium]|jgi:formamidopyrimidine-DNA glycosylase|nr:DNA-formamidopyrimidine glycosylase family protein [Acetobacteraceae bacterium]
MPELPDVEIFKRLVEQHCIGRVITRTDVADPGSLEGATAAALQRRLKGKRLLSSGRHGKVLFVGFEDAGTLAMHFGTNGSLQHVPRDAEEPPYVRIQFEFAEGDRLAYINPRRIGRVSATDSAAAFIADQQLGPDALDPAFDEKAFAATIANRRQAIKAVLMDQARIAGIGNIYADEILFQARLHPAIAANGLDAGMRHRLFAAMKHALQTAIDCGAGAENFTDRLPKGFLLPERHAGGHCPRCGTPLMIDKRGGRTSYHCPKCQPEPTG